MRRPIKKLITLKCSHCSKEFQKYPSQVKTNKDTVFCGNQCVIDYRKIHWKGKIDRKCIQCGAEFKIPKSGLKRCKGAGSYCSKKCQSSRSFILNCIICNKEFKAYKCDIDRGNKKFCSRSCAGKESYKNKSCFQWKTPEERFFSYILKGNDSNSCWTWTGLKNKAGYGRLRMEYSDKTAHRYSWELHNGKIPKGKIICHKCDNPTCVNPNHLYAGTHKDNAQDRENRNRGRHRFKKLII
jgi:hypothetical protein